jgi:hypothetical protein
VELLASLSDSEESELAFTGLKKRLFACLFKFRIRIPAFPFHDFFFWGVYRQLSFNTQELRDCSIAVFRFDIALFRISDPTAVYDRGVGEEDKTTRMAWILLLQVEIIDRKTRGFRI